MKSTSRLHFTLQGVTKASYAANVLAQYCAILRSTSNWFKGGIDFGCRPVAAVAATTTTPNSIHKMSETEEEEKMTRFLSTVDSFLNSSRRRERKREVAEAGFVRMASTRLAFC